MDLTLVIGMESSAGSGLDNILEYLDVANFESHINDKGYTDTQVENKLWNLGYTAADGSDIEADLVSGDQLSKQAFDGASDTI